MRVGTTASIPSSLVGQAVTLHNRGPLGGPRGVGLGGLRGWPSVREALTPQGRVSSPGPGAQGWGWSAREQQGAGGRVHTTEGVRDRGAPSLRWWQGCGEGLCGGSKREGRCSTVGGPGAGRGWALKVGAHSLCTAAATSTSRRVSAGSSSPGASSAAAAPRQWAQCRSARPSGCLLLPRAALRGPCAAPPRPPTLHGCGRRAAPSAPQPCGGRHGITRPWCAEIASAGGCAWPCGRPVLHGAARGGVAGSGGLAWGPTAVAKTGSPENPTLQTQPPLKPSR
jgi:hypothetical protein